MNLQEFLAEVGGKENQFVTYESHEEALEAVKQDGYSLQYVNEQTEAICLEAVKQNGYSLRYVNKNVFIMRNKQPNSKGVVSWQRAK